MLLPLRWVAATMAGFAFGGFMFHFAGSFGGLASWDPFAVAFGGAMGFVTGVAVAGIQWATLWLSRRQGARLMLAMGLTIGVTHGLQDGAPNSIGFVTVAAASGIAVAAIFAALFDQRAPAALLASSVGWAGGLVVANWLTFSVLGLPGTEAPIDSAIQHTVVGIIVALAWGVSTAITGLPSAIRNHGRRLVEAGGPGGSAT